MDNMDPITGALGLEPDQLGRLVRQAWVDYCTSTGDTKATHLAPWEDLGVWDRDADQAIGHAVALFIVGRIVQVSQPSLDFAVDESSPEQAASIAQFYQIVQLFADHMVQQFAASLGHGLGSWQDDSLLPYYAQTAQDRLDRVIQDKPAEIGAAIMLVMIWHLRERWRRGESHT